MLLMKSSLFLYCKSDIEAFQYYFILNGAIFLKVHFSYERHFVLDCLNWCAIFSYSETNLSEMENTF